MNLRRPHRSPVEALAAELGPPCYLAARRPTTPLVTVAEAACIMKRTEAEVRALAESGIMQGELVLGDWMVRPVILRSPPFA